MALHAPIHIASEKNDTSVVELLAGDKRCDTNIQDTHGDTALHSGVNNAEIVKHLIEKCHANCDIHNRKGQTPFHKAIATGVLASVEAFLINGVDIQQSDIYKDAPIHIACQYSRFNMQFWATKHVILTNRMLMEIQHFIL